MKNRYLSTRIMAIMMAAAMAVSAAPAAFAAERADSETIKEDNQPAADADSDTQEDADAQDSADADKTADAEGTKTEYPLTITTYDYDNIRIAVPSESTPEISLPVVFAVCKCSFFVLLFLLSPISLFLCFLLCCSCFFRLSRLFILTV